MFSILISALVVISELPLIKWLIRLARQSKIVRTIRNWKNRPDAVTQAYRELDLAKVRRRLKTMPIAICPKTDPADPLELGFIEFLRRTCEAAVGGSELCAERSDAILVRTALFEHDGETALEVEVVATQSSVVNHFKRSTGAAGDENGNLTFLAAAKFLSKALENPQLWAAAA